MKVTKGHPVARALVCAGIAAAVIAPALFSAPASAEAITRTQIVARAKKWVDKKVPYSQSRYHRGYRQDCSGFVSMAWRLNRSYTSWTLSSRARRVPISELKPGDVVWKPGHVSVFGGWKNKRKRTYIALEQTTWGSHAKKRVRTIPSNAKGLRYKRLTPKKRVAVRTVSASSVTPTVGAIAAAEITAALAKSDDGTTGTAGVASISAY